EWCRECVNDSPSEIKDSLRVFERVTLPKGEKGPAGGVGSMDDPWPKPTDWQGYQEFGSAGLFDLLGGSGVYAGIHQGFTPMLTRPAANFRDLRAQIYMVTWMVYRVLQSSKYKVLVPGDPSAT